MAEKLKIIPLGGLNEIGKNMTVLEYGKDIIIVDCGLGFPDEEMYGVDLVIADMTYLVKNKDKIRGMFLTHGHEDHIGGIPYAMEQFNCPSHATRLTAGIVQLKLEEHQLQNTVHLFTHEAGEKVKAGCFTVEFIHVNHSIADAVAFAIKTPVGTIVMTGDFKIDATAEDGMIDLARFGALGKEGVLALLCDSTNVERQGYTPSEKTVAANFERQFSGCNKRIIVTTFAANAFRLQSLIATAKKFGRKVAVTGRSMEPTLHDRKSRVRLQAAPEMLPRGAVVLYKRDNGQYVLHRVAACRGETYDFCGDAQWVLERGLRREQILAVVTEFQRTDRWTSVNSAGYGLYWRALLAVRPLRRFAHRAAGWLRWQVTRERNR